MSAPPLPLVLDPGTLGRRIAALAWAGLRGVHD